MKVFFILCALAGVALVAEAGLTSEVPAGKNISERGCLYVVGRCYKECEEGTHSYTVGCAEVVSERTCDEPVSKKLPGTICDLSRCECDEPNVKDKRTGKCVSLEECSKDGVKNEEVEGEGARV